MKQLGKLCIVLFITVLAFSCCLFSISYATTLKSNDYQFTDQSVGGNGLEKSNSANYGLVQESGGILGSATSASTSFQIKAGNSTTSDPALAFAITNSNVALGSFSPGSAATATATFQVSDYTSYGYVVQVVGNPPNLGSHTLTAMSTTGPSQAGVEQFGINLVANTAPVSLGANPNHGQFGVGSASANYGTTNNYRYVSGETIASGPKSGGLTTYTISYIANVTDFTPSGSYSGSQTIVCTGTY
jgi:hypothetical protein